MIVLYNILFVILVAVVSWLGIKFSNIEEYFVALGVIDVVYLIVVFGYMMFT
jgi:hypothetical protein